MGSLIVKLVSSLLIIVCFVLAGISMSLSGVADESGQLQATIETKQLIDEWVERLEVADPQDVESEIAALEQADSDSADYHWRIAVMARLIHDEIHFERAASYLLDHIDPIDDHPVVSLSQKLMNDLVPVLLDRLESKVPSVFEAGTKWTIRFHSISAEHSGRIRDLIWNYTDQPYRQVEGCRLLARLAVVTEDDLQAIIACLESPDNIVVKSALQTAVEMNSPEMLPLMRKHLKHINDDIVIESAAAILRLSEREPGDVIHQDAIVEAVSVLEKRYFGGQQKEVMNIFRDVGKPILLAPALLRDAIATSSVMIDGAYFSHDTGIHVSASDALIRCGADSLPLIRTLLSDPDTPPLIRHRLLTNLLSISAEQSSIRPVVEQQLTADDEGVQDVTIELLTKYRDVDARLLEQTVPAHLEGKRLWIVALGFASAESREVAIRLLEPCVLEGSPYHRVAAASSLLALGHRSISIDNLADELIPLLDDANWRGHAELIDVMRQVRPSPAGLADKLLAVMTFKEAGNSHESVESQDRFTVAVRCAELLGTLDASAYDARIQLLHDPSGDVRRRILLQLGESGDPRALFSIVSHLFDRSTYWVSVSNHVGYTEEIRDAAIEAIANPAMDVTAIVPMLCDLLSEDWAAVDAARALSHCKLKSEVILPRLYALELDEVNAGSLAIAATAAKLELDESKRFALLKQLLRLVRDRANVDNGFSRSFASNFGLFDTLLELHDDGISLEPVRTDLAYLAIEQPLLAFNARAEAVAILAVIEPEDPRWMKRLTQWRSEEKYGFGTVESLLEELLRRSSPVLQEP